MSPIKDGVAFNPLSIFMRTHFIWYFKDVEEWWWTSLSCIIFCFQLVAKLVGGEIICSTRSVSTGLFCKAIWIERASLDWSKGVRRPDFLITINSRNCTRSNVVNRPPQLLHWRRRRTAVLSSAWRESLTWVSSDEQNGQRIGLHRAVPEWCHIIFSAVDAWCAHIAFRRRKTFLILKSRHSSKIKSNS